MQGLLLYQMTSRFRDLRVAVRGNVPTSHWNANFFRIGQLPGNCIVCTLATLSPSLRSEAIHGLVSSHFFKDAGFTCDSPFAHD
jgi:hypothetical protein